MNDMMSDMSGDMSGDMIGVSREMIGVSREMTRDMTVSSQSSDDERHDSCLISHTIQCSQGGMLATRRHASIWYRDIDRGKRRP